MIDRYFARQFITWFAIVGLALSAITALSQVIELIAIYPQAQLGDLVRLGLLSTPRFVYSISPIIVILGGAVAFISISRRSELTVARAAGLPLWRVARGPFVAALGLGILALVVINPIVAGSLRSYDQHLSTLSGSSTRSNLVGRDGLWLRQGDAQGQSVIHALDASADGTTLFVVDFIMYDSHGALTQRVRAQRAQLREGAWDLSHGKSWPLDAPNPELAAQSFAQLKVPTTLTAERIRDGFGDPAAITIWDLPEFITHLNEAGFPALRHKTWLQAEFARPVYWLALALVAASFTLQHLRGGGLGIMIMGAVMTGFAMDFGLRFAMVLGNTGKIPPSVAAWLPVLVCFAAGVWGISRKEYR